MTPERLAQLVALDASLGTWQATAAPNNDRGLIVTPAGIFDPGRQPLTVAQAQQFVAIREAMTELIAAVS